MLSATLRCGNSPACWITYPMPRRSSCTGSVRMSVPSSHTVPPVGSTSRLIILSVVVLPQPDGPTSATSSPRGMVRSSSLTAGAAAPG